MTRFFFPKLAFDGIRKNRRMYLPFLLTCIGMVMMLYIMAFLQYDDFVYQLPQGGDLLRSITALGSWVVAAFSCLFLFYTNSFLIRRRKKEFGLYYILGMNKRSLLRILFWETLITAGISLALGLTAGFACSKLAELFLARLLKTDVVYTFVLLPGAAFFVLKIFSVIFFLLFLNSLRQIRFASAVSLLRSETIGEKPPKANWVLGLLGFILLAIAYWLAVTVADPYSALIWFFVAVLLVIAGTYLLMIAGSVLFCRLLQKNKRYYYRTNHFISVSSMAYRMKRNGAGLASICVLATMVLVMISSTSCLYFGIEDSLRGRYPRELTLSVTSITPDALDPAKKELLRNALSDMVSETGGTASDLQDYSYISLWGYLTGNTVTDGKDAAGITTASSSDYYLIRFLSLDAYNQMVNSSETLAPGEAIVSMNKGGYDLDTIRFQNGTEFRIRKQTMLPPFAENLVDAAVPVLYLTVPDLMSVYSEFPHRDTTTESWFASAHWVFNFDTGLDKDMQIDLYNDVLNTPDSPLYTSEMNAYSISLQSRAFNEKFFFSDFASLFFLAIVLSIVFLFATVLIIYYKQISEGYEDQARFEIMQKVGMTRREIRKSINSQLLTVFFLPLVLAGLHLIFAFPMVRHLLMMFSLNNWKLFFTSNLISFAVFAVFYILVYRLTSNAYYNIVSGTGKEN